MGANGRLRKREGENTDAAPLMRETVHLAWIMLLLVGIPSSWRKKQANCSQKKNRLCRTDGMSVNPTRRRDKELGTDRYLLLFSPTNNWDSFFFRGLLLSLLYDMKLYKRKNQCRRLIDGLCQRSIWGHWIFFYIFPIPTWLAFNSTWWSDQIAWLPLGGGQASPLIAGQWKPHMAMVGEMKGTMMRPHWPCEHVTM